MFHLANNVLLSASVVVCRTEGLKCAGLLCSLLIYSKDLCKLSSRFKIDYINIFEFSCVGLSILFV